MKDSMHTGLPSDVDYFHSISKIIFGMIPEGTRVLDVGCSTGRLGERLRNERSCFVAGIEVNHNRSELARTRLDFVLAEDVEHIQELPFATESFDVVVFADALEHFKSPESVLLNISRYVKQTGFGIFSIPNVANWSLRLKLLLGRWDYKERGLLDSTHLRFFTLKNARRLLTECGYRVVRTRCTSGWSWLDWRMPKRNPANLWKGVLACDFVFAAIKVGAGDAGSRQA